MKTFILSLLAIISGLFCHSQSVIPTLWGMNSVGGMPFGGASSYGNIYSVKADGSNFMQQYYFGSYPGDYPIGELIEGADGKFYGMTYLGGTHNKGLLFRIDPSLGPFADHSYEKLIDFDSASYGSYPKGSLMQASDNKLYGLSSKGGAYDHGILFNYDPTTNIFTKLHDFNGTDGSRPEGSLMQASNGKLYGVTMVGGIATPGSMGVLFSYDIITHVFLKLYDFDFVLNGFWISDLTESNGKLYSIGSKPAPSGFGVINAFDISTNTNSVVYNIANFNDGNASLPIANTPKLILGTNGKFYGTTLGGGVDSSGVIFSFDPVTNIYHKLFDFGGPNGKSPLRICQANNGLLYGATREGGIGFPPGSLEAGILYSFDINTNQFTRIFNFDIQVGYPVAGLLKSTNGKLYFFTSSFIYALDPSSNLVQRMLEFSLGSSSLPRRGAGHSPSGSLTQANDGSLLGLTSLSAFKLDPRTSVFELISHFWADHWIGNSAYGNLVQGRNGNYFGLTSGDDSLNKGIAFEFNPSTRQYNILHHFSGSNDAKPYGSLVTAGNGLMYGMTNGFLQYSGSIFNYNPQTGIITVDTSFTNYNGVKPYGSLIQARDGKLYGLTAGYGNFSSSSGGSLFSFEPISRNLEVHKIFSTQIRNDGYNGTGDLVQATNGMLYGMMSQGGINESGTLFQFDIPTGLVTKLHDFDSIGGKKPMGTLMEASNGKLYGLTNLGGINNAGVLFEFNPSNNNYIKILDFDTLTTGGHPKYTKLIEAPSPTENCVPYFFLVFDSIQSSWTAVFYGVGSTPINYTWNWGDGTTTTGSSGTHTYSSPGYYNICLLITDSAGCSNSFCVNNTYLNGSLPVLINLHQTGVGINEPIRVKPLSIYPNPVQDNLHFTNNELKSYEIEIYNTLGALILKTKERNIIDVSNLSSGIYILKFQAEDDVLIKRFVKQ